MKHQCGLFDILYTMLIPLCALVFITPVAMLLWYLRRNSCYLVNAQGKEIINMFITHIVIICGLVLLVLVAAIMYPLRSLLIGIGLLFFALFHLYYSIGLAISCVYVLFGNVFHFHYAIHICKKIPYQYNNVAQ